MVGFCFAQTLLSIWRMAFWLPILVIAHTTIHQTPFMTTYSKYIYNSIEKYATLTDSDPEWYEQVIYWFIYD